MQTKALRILQTKNVYDRFLRAKNEHEREREQWRERMNAAELQTQDCG